MKRVWVAVVCGLAVMLGGCSASADIPPETPSATAPQSPTGTATPVAGRSLKSVGLTNGAASLIWLPTGTVLTYTADQPNLLIASGNLDQAATVEAYLVQWLPVLGWTITGQGDGGLLFEQGEWHGGYARGDTTWALTVRNDEGG